MGERRKGNPLVETIVYDLYNSPPHCLNTTDVNNYSVSTIGKWSCEDTILKRSVHSAHLADFEKFPNGSNSMIVGENAPKTCYRPLFALALETLRF